MLLIITLLSTAIGFLATINVILWKPRKIIKRNRIPKVSILKPIRGMEPDLEINLHSFFNLNQIVPFELLFCVKNPEDPSIGIIRDLMRLHPQVEAKLYTNTKDLGKNPKVSNMYSAWNDSDSDLILISDSNVKVEPDYLEVIMAERQAGAGLVTQSVYGADAQSWGGHLDVIHLNTFYLKATGFLEMFGFSCVLGKCMLFSKSQFDNLGGLFSVRNYLAEDLVAGEMMRDAGYTVQVAPQLLRQTTIMNNFNAYWNRHVRWARLRKCHVIFAYLLEPLFFETLWPVLLMATATSSFEWWAGVGALLVQLSCNAGLHAFKFRDDGAWRSFQWFLPKDLMAPLIWIAGLSSNQVIWRGQHLSLRFGGKLGGKYTWAARRRQVQSRLQLRKISQIF